jgi:uncharacterized membrane protein
MANVTKSIDVDVPIEQAYNQWTQFESFPEFMGGVDSITQLDERRNHWKVTIAGQTREFDTEITEQNPEERIAWRTVSGKGHAGVVTFHKLGPTETRVTVQMDWEPEGVTEKVGAAAGVDDRQVQSDLERFKKFIESRPAETGAWRGEVPREG